MAKKKVPSVHKGLTAQAERGIDLHVLYAAVLPSFFVRLWTDQAAPGDPTETSSSNSRNNLSVIQVTSIVLIEATDSCLMPADFFVVNAWTRPIAACGS